MYLYIYIYIYIYIYDHGVNDPFQLLYKTFPKPISLIYGRLQASRLILECENWSHNPRL